MDDEVQRVSELVSHSLMNMKELLDPVLDSAEGIKADMVARGWSPQNAESLTITADGDLTAPASEAS